MSRPASFPPKKLSPFSAIATELLYDSSSVSIVFALARGRSVPEYGEFLIDVMEQPARCQAKNVRG